MRPLHDVTTTILYKSTGICTGWPYSGRVKTVLLVKYFTFDAILSDASL